MNFICTSKTHLNNIEEYSHKLLPIDWRISPALITWAASGARAFSQIAVSVVHVPHAVVGSYRRSLDWKLGRCNQKEASWEGLGRTTCECKCAQFLWGRGLPVRNYLVALYLDEVKKVMCYKSKIIYFPYIMNL